MDRNDMETNLTEVQKPGIVEETIKYLTETAIANIWKTYEVALQGEDPQMLYTGYQQKKGCQA